MAAKTSYVFSDPVRGQFTLQLDAPKKQVYQIDLEPEDKCRCVGLKPQTPIDQLLFFEWQQVDYQYIVDISDASLSLRPPFAFNVNGQPLRESKQHNATHYFSGNFSFKDAIGQTRFTITDANGNAIFELHAHVFPQKMDYKLDYRVMKEDIAAILPSLAFAHARSTFMTAKTRETGFTTIQEWYSILKALTDQFISSVRVIQNHPKHSIIKEQQVLPVNHVKRLANNHASWFARNTRYRTTAGNGLQVTEGHWYSKAPAIIKKVTYDTPENQFVAWALKQTWQQCNLYAKYLTKHDIATAKHELLLHLNEVQATLQGFLHSDPFLEVSPFRFQNQFSETMMRGLGYQSFLHCYLLLLRGLNFLESDIFKIDQKKISTIYEYWCFLKLVDIVKNYPGAIIISQDLVKLERKSVKVNLKSGQASAIQFQLKQGEKITLYYNRTFKKDLIKVFTYDQKPDYTLKFEKQGYLQPFWYLFDAKYRFEEKTIQDTSTYDAPQEAIGQLHRYRDAILHSVPQQSTYKQAIKNLGGIILYPFPNAEQEFEKNKYYQSLQHYNIGALPFLPTKTNLARKFLKTLFEQIPHEHFENFVELDRREYMQKRAKWDDWILFGLLREKERAKRLKWIVDHHKYCVRYIPKNIEDKRIFLTKKVVLYDHLNERTILKFDVDGWDIVTRQALQSDHGATWKMSTPRYLVFTLSNKTDLNIHKKIVLDKGFRYTTEEGLARLNVSADALYLTHADAGRLFDALHQLQVNFQLDWSGTEDDPSAVRFLIKKPPLTILSTSTSPPLKYNCNGEEKHLDEVLRLLKPPHI